jgi:hypothetical protein
LVFKSPQKCTGGALLPVWPEARRVFAVKHPFNILVLFPTTKGIKDSQESIFSLWIFSSVQNLTTLPPIRQIQQIPSHRRLWQGLSFVSANLFLGYCPAFGIPHL